MDCKPGDSLGPYALVELIKKGSINEAWRARNGSQDGLEVMLKTISPQNSNAKRLFERELAALRRLDHDCVSRLLDYGHSNGTDYLIFELLEGCTLRERMEADGGRLTLRAALPVFSDILNGLDHIHKNKVVHLDINPDNVFISAEGRAKIIDFSIAQVRSLSQSNAVEFADLEDMLAGTMAYMPPEQWGERSLIDEPSDLYSFGILLYETLTGEQPFKAERLVEFLEAHKHAPAPSLLALQPELPYELEEIYLRLLAKKKENRYQTARAVDTALRQVALDLVEKETETSRIPSHNSDEIPVGNENDPTTIPPTLPIEKALFCPSCGAKLKREETARQFCRACGANWAGLDMVPCSECGGDAPVGHHYCPGCGYRPTIIEAPARKIPKPAVKADENIVENISATVIRCDLCGTYNSYGWAFCQGCGEKLEREPGQKNGGRDSHNSSAHLSPNVISIETVPPKPANSDGTSEEQYGGGADWADINTAVVFGEQPSPGEQIEVITARPAYDEAEENPAYELEYSAKSLISFGTPMAKARRDSTLAPAGDAPRFSPKMSQGVGEPRIPTLKAGTMIDSRYRVEQYIAQGGFANIYLVVDTRSYLNEELVVKVPMVEDDPDDLVRQLRSQLKVWKLLSDTEPEHVVRLLKVERIRAGNAEAVGIFMEHLAGGNLAKMVKTRWNSYPRNREQMARLMRLFLQVCSSVRSLHSHGFLHRDIKPVNLLLDSTESNCKLSDFELVVRTNEYAVNPGALAGTPSYMAPESFEGRYSVVSDIFSLGATLYQLLCGELPFELESPMVVSRNPPADLTERNPIIPPELNQIVMRCLELKPEHRPPSVDDLIEELIRLGIADEGANIAPLNLARLLINTLGKNEEDLNYLTDSLKRSGFRSHRSKKHQQADIIEEYCYTASPHEILSQNCTGRQLAALAEELGLKPVDGTSREELIDSILEAIGFLRGPRPIHGIETTRSYLEDQLVDLGNATSSDECIGIVHSGLGAVERIIGLLVRFYGQLLYGSGLESFLSRCANKEYKKSADSLTFGEKVGVLRKLCLEQPDIPLADRVREAFHWPVIPKKIFKQIDELVSDRNHLAHQIDLGGFHWAQRFGRKVLSTAIEVLKELSQNRHTPSVVQIVSRQDDVYGRHYYLGQNDRGHLERIFTPLPLEVGQLYLFLSLTNPARINPLIFPYDTSKQKGKGSSNAGSAKKGPQSRSKSR